jgi:hypothetical protein
MFAALLKYIFVKILYINYIIVFLISSYCIIVLLLESRP